MASPSEPANDQTSSALRDTTSASGLPGAVGIKDSSSGMVRFHHQEGPACRRSD